MDNAVPAVATKVLHPGNVKRLLQEVHDRLRLALGPASSAKVNVFGLLFGGVERLLQTRCLASRGVWPKIAPIPRTVGRDNDAVSCRDDLL